MATEEELEILVSSPNALATAAQLGQITRSFTDLDKVLGGNGGGRGGSGGATYNFQINFNGNFNQFNGDLNETTNNLNQLDKGFRAVGNSLNFFKALFIAREFLRFGEWIADTSDQLINLRNRVQTATDDIGGSAEKTTQILINMAQQTGTPVDKLSVSFLRLTEATKGLGANSDQVLRVTKSLAEATALAGRNPEELSVGLQKLSKALEFGVNKGQELKAIFAEYPSLGDAIAQHFQVPVDKLKDLAAQGKITGSGIMEAIIEASDTIDGKFAKLDQTFDRAWTTFKVSALDAFEALGLPLSGLAKQIAHMGDGLLQVVALIKAVEEAANNFHPKMPTNDRPSLGTSEKILGFFRKIWDKDAEFEKSLMPTEGPARSGSIADRAAQFLAEMRAQRDADIDKSQLDNPLHGGGSPKSKTERGKTWQQILQDESAREAITAKSANPDISSIAAENAAKQAKLAWSDWREEVDKLKPSLKAQLGDLDDYINGSKQLTPIAQQLKDIADKRAADTMAAELNKKSIEAILKDEKERLATVQKVAEEEAKADAQRKAANEKLAIGALNAPNIFGISGAKSTNDQITELERLAKNPDAIKEALAAMHEPAENVDVVLKDINIQIELLRESLNPLAVLFKSLTNSIVDGFSQAVAQSIVLHKNFGTLIVDLAKMIEMQAISGIVKIGLNAGINSLVGAAVGDVGQATSQAAGAAGVNAGNQNFSAQFDALLGNKHSAGGYTGDYGVNQPAGIVHGQEYVLNARATAAIGRSNLDAMNSGGSVGPRITINNNAPGVIVTQGSVSRDEVQIMVKQGVAQHAPSVVAGQLNQANSPVSKAMRNNIDSNRRVL